MLRTQRLYRRIRLIGYYCHGIFSQPFQRREYSLIGFGLILAMGRIMTPEGFLNRIDIRTLRSSLGKQMLCTTANKSPDLLSAPTGMTVLLQAIIDTVRQIIQRIQQSTVQIP